MTVFRTIGEISQHLNSSDNLQKYKSNINDIIKSETKLLMHCIQDRLDLYYASYKPEIYKRRGTPENPNPNPLRYGLELGSLQVYKYGNKIIHTMNINFKSENSYHDSIFGGDPGFVPNLINYGWTWHSKDGPYRLARFDGDYFVEAGIEDYYAISKYNFKININVTYDGNKIVDKQFSRK